MIGGPSSPVPDGKEEHGPRDERPSRQLVGGPGAVRVGRGLEAPEQGRRPARAACRAGAGVPLGGVGVRRGDAARGSRADQWPARPPTVAMTLDIYAHAIPALQHDTANTIADLVASVATTAVAGGLG
jgi:hypothetical protein